MGEIAETEYDMEMFDYEQLPTHSIYVTMTAGAAAGIMEHCLMYPIDSLKTRIQSLCPCPEQSCRTPVSGFMEMAKREGFLGTYRGVNAIAVGAIPAHALYFSVYEKLKTTLTGGQAGHSNTWAYGLSGGAATVVHDAVMNPAEVIKQRMQMCGSPYKSTLECCRCIVRHEGMRALYR
jgi:solute carrier family 25 iron transporter 28/37